MISPYAVENYLSRELRDLNVRKRWSAAKVERKLSELSPRPTFVTEPHHYQRIGFYLLATLPHVLLLWDMGLGKTKTVLDVVRWHKAAKHLKRVLVLVPNVVNLDSWRAEIEKHAPDLTASYVFGDKQARMEAVEEETDLCVCTYAGLNHLCCGKVKGKSKKKMVIDPQRMAHVRGQFQGVVWDECTALLNHRSLQFQIARELGKDYTMRVGMTGTPMGRDPHVLWSQFYAVDRGETLGSTLGIFRQAFFTSRENYWGGWDHVFKRSMTPQLQRLMANRSIRYRADECMDLPEKIMVERPVRMTDEQWDYYRAVLDRVREEHKSGLLDVENAFVRLRQITSGFVSVGGEPSALAASPKLDTLLAVIDELDESEKMVVWNEFIYSGDRIAEALEERGVTFSRLYSGTKDKAGELQRFLDTGEHGSRVLVANSRSGSFGTNLQVARYEVFYESPVSPIVREQAERRCLRQGQKRSVFIYDIIARHTIDQKIQRFLAEGKDLSAALMGGGYRLLEEREKL